MIHATRLVNGSSSPELRSVYHDEQVAALARIGDTPLSELETLSAWRRTFSGFGVKPTQYRNAAEALLRRLTKQGDIPSINTLVDIANTVSIRHGLPVAVFDQALVTGSTTVCFANSDEEFTDLGSKDVSNPEPGEVIFVDEAKKVSARRWCWRQSAQSAAGPTTIEAVITVEGQHDAAGADVEKATQDLMDLLAVYQPGSEKKSALLSPQVREFPSQ